MDQQTVRAHIEHVGVIPCIRTSSADDAQFAAETVAEAGIPIVEITMTVPGALRVITELRRLLPGVAVGAGTVLDVEMARRSLDAGATFLTSPALDLSVVECAKKAHVLAMPGALTTTEVVAAWRGGADFVKIFPCAQVGGEGYIRALKAPLPDIPLIAAGGVNQQTVGGFIRAGAIAVDVGTDLVPRRAVELRQSEWIAELARRFIGLVDEARRHPFRERHPVEAP